MAEVGLYLWAAGLLLLGIRVVRGLSWPRTLIAYGVAVALFAAVGIFLTLL
jgi:hypothetical protein